MIDESSVRYPRRMYIAIAVLFVALVLISISLLKIQGKRNTPEAVTNPKEEVQVKTKNKDNKTNLLIKTNDLQNINNDYLRRTGQKSTNNVDLHFTYELAPSLRKKSKVSPSPVLGATSCTLENAPDKVNIYTVLSHLNQENASNVAMEYGIDSEPYSLPTETSSYQYFFSGENNSSFLSIYEPSGAYVFHKAASPSADIVSTAQLRSISDGLLTQHNLSDGTEFITNRNINDLKEFIYKHPYGDLPNIDSNSLRALGMDKSICNVEQALEMGNIEVSLLPDGNLYKLINNTRKILDIKSANRIELEDSLIEYEDNTIYPPIVIPEGSAQSGKVVLDEAVMIYFDYGKNFPQKYIMPVYAASGLTTDSTGKTVRVITMLPVVSLDELIDLGILNSEVKSVGNTSQKQSTFTIEEPTVPPPPNTSGGTGKCFGNLVDYTVQCSQSGQYVCSSFFGIPPQEDKLNICTAGCKSLSGTVYTNGADPCKIFLEQKKINTDYYVGGGVNSIEIKGDVSCVINACPC
jgi:hypothetical protein